MMPSQYDQHVRNSPTSAFRRILLLREPDRPADRTPLINTSTETKKKSFVTVMLRGFGCASDSATQAYAPAAAEAEAVRPSGDWKRGGKRSRKTRVKQKRRRGKNGAADSAAAASAADIWCAPGLAFNADDPVDCVVVQHHPAIGRGSLDAERGNRERSYMQRHGNEQDFSTSFDESPSILEMPLFGSDRIVSGRLRRRWGYRRSPSGLEEVLMFQTRMLLGEVELHDQYRDMRLDVDNMSYEELLELGDKIGYVSTGLREEDIHRRVRKAKHSTFGSASFRISSEVDRKCCICQEEYGGGDEVGKLECGHIYHLCCIKQWLLLKNSCPVCKISISG